MLPAEQLLGQMYPPEVNSKSDESLEILSSLNVRLHREKVQRQQEAMFLAGLADGGLEGDWWGLSKGGRSWCNAQLAWSQREDHVLTCVSLRGRSTQRVWGLGEKSKRRAGGRLTIAGGQKTWLFQNKCGGPLNPACSLADSPLNCHGALGQPAKRQCNQSKQAVSHSPQQQRQQTVPAAYFLMEFSVVNQQRINSSSTQRAKHW